MGIKKLRIVHEDIQTFLHIRLGNPQRICVSLVSNPFTSRGRKQNRLSGALCKASEMRRIRLAIPSDAIPFEDKASSTNCKQKENSDVDNVRNNSVIFSSRLYRSVRNVNAKKIRDYCISVDAPADTDKWVKTIYVVTMRCM
jgi:hypothetical protein